MVARTYPALSLCGIVSDVKAFCWMVFACCKKRISSKPYFMRLYNSDKKEENQMKKLYKKYNYSCPSKKITIEGTHNGMLSLLHKVK